MRHSSSNRRSRNNRGRSSNRPNKNQVFDSNGPEARVRGTAQQIADKYEALAKDAATSDDPTLAQNYLQHAEHYTRIYLGFLEAEEKERQRKEEDLSLPNSMLQPANSEEESNLETA